MLADAEHIEAGFIGKLGGGDDFGTALLCADRDAGFGIGRQVAESIKSEFQCASFAISRKVVARSAARLSRFGPTLRQAG
jgi:hypothetical protein